MNDIDILQEKVAYQEQTIDKLNEALANQQQQILRLQDEVKMLAQLLREWRSGNQEGSANAGSQIVHELPPHY